MVAIILKCQINSGKVIILYEILKKEVTTKSSFWMLLFSKVCTARKIINSTEP